MKEISFRNDVLPLKDKLFRLALRITLNREEAEDIVQDTDKSLELARQMATVRLHRSLQPHYRKKSLARPHQEDGESERIARR